MSSLCVHVFLLVLRQLKIIRLEKQRTNTALIGIWLEVGSVAPADSSLLIRRAVDCHAGGALPCPLRRCRHSLRAHRLAAVATRLLHAAEAKPWRRTTLKEGQR